MKKLRPRVKKWMYYNDLCKHIEKKMSKKMHACMCCGHSSTEVEHVEYGLYQCINVQVCMDNCNNAPHHADCMCEECELEIYTYQPDPSEEDTHVCYCGEIVSLDMDDVANCNGKPRHVDCAYERSISILHDI
jgi:hypothetical protein